MEQTDRSQREGVRGLEEISQRTYLCVRIAPGRRQQHGEGQALEEGRELDGWGQRRGSGGHQ